MFRCIEFFPATSTGRLLQTKELGFLVWKIKKILRKVPRKSGAILLAMMADRVHKRSLQIVQQALESLPKETVGHGACGTIYF